MVAAVLGAARRVLLRLAHAVQTLHFHAALHGVRPDTAVGTFAVSTAHQKPIWQSGCAARLLSRPRGTWRVPHGVGKPGDIAFVPYQVLARPSNSGGYTAGTESSGSGGGAR